MIIVITIRMLRKIMNTFYQLEVQFASFFHVLSKLSPDCLVWNLTRILFSIPNTIRTASLNFSCQICNIHFQSNQGPLSCMLYCSLFLRLSYQPFGFSTLLCQNNEKCLQFYNYIRWWSHKSQQTMSNLFIKKHAEYRTTDMNGDCNWLVVSFIHPIIYEQVGVVYLFLFYLPAACCLIAFSTTAFYCIKKALQRVTLSTE